ncbi:MAG TPA: ArgE/DapE family deacylase [Acidimicrobiia bacterium]
MTGMRADRDRVVAELAALVAVPSVTGHERTIQDEVAHRMAGDGLDVRRVEPPAEELMADPDFPGVEVEHGSFPVVAGHLGSSRPGPRILVVGHSDVVPPGEPASWTTPAFQPDVRDGRLYGRGACDMKGGLVSILEAMRLLRESGAVRRGEVVAVSVPAEEDGGAGSLAAIRAGYTGDFCVITEPTDLEVVVAHAGAITFTLDVPGKAAHASMRREGVSALSKLEYLIAALEEDERLRNEAEVDPRMRAIGLPYPTIIGQVEGGNWASTVMDRVVAHGRYGVTLGQDGVGAAADLRRAVTAAWEADEWLSRHPVGLEVWGARFDSSGVPEGHPLAVGLADSHRRVTAEPTALVGVPYGADMRLFINQGHTPTVMYGPGDVRVAHAADEFVPIDQVTTCAEVLATWIAGELG